MNTNLLLTALSVLPWAMLTGEAEAARTTAVGQAEAAVLKAKVDAVGPDKYALMNVVDKIADNKIALVPQIIAGGENGGSSRGSGLVDVLLGSLVAERLNGHAKPA